MRRGISERHADSAGRGLAGAVVVGIDVVNWGCDWEALVEARAVLRSSNRSLASEVSCSEVASSEEVEFLFFCS